MTPPNGMFFQDYKEPLSKSIGITHLLSNITTRAGSHKGGWTRLLKCQLNTLGYTNVKILDNSDSLDAFDIIIFDLGAEYSGAINMFGGLDEKVFGRLRSLKNFKGSLYSWRNELPDVRDLEPRRGNVSTCQLFKDSESSFLSDVKDVLDTAKMFLHAYITERLLLGDSHTPSVWTPDYMIERRDGRTLKGMLDRQTIKMHLNTFPFIKEIHIHCGSIDIRHHVCREKDPEQTAAEYVIGLVTQLHDFELTKITLNHTMGIEDESRELPKTGYYKGTAYYGTWEQRNRCRLIFNEVIDDFTKDCEGWNRIKLPSYFFDENGKLKFEVMEVPGSVHLSPAHYRWDLDNNKDRWIHEEGR